MENEKKNTSTTKRIVTYLIITFGITYLFEFFVMYLNSKDKNISQLLLSSSGAFAMFMPTVGVILTRLITHEGFSNNMLAPHINKVTIKYYLIAWFGPAILTIMGAVLYFVCFKNDFSMSMDYLMNVYAQRGTDITIDDLRKIMYSQTITAVLIAPLLNCVTCFGEEWGWRGYLLPKLMEKMSLASVLLLSGVIWGLWHMPLIIMGHNYGVGYNFYPYGGILAMCVFCIVIGTFLSFVTIKTNSVLPAVIGHGAINGIASFGIFFSKTGGNPFVGPSLVGILGGLPMIIVAIVMGTILIKSNKQEVKIETI